MRMATIGNSSQKPEKTFVIPAPEDANKETRMKKFTLMLSILLSTTAMVLAASGYHLLKKIPVGGQGSWDYLSVDEANRRVYVSHETQVDVLDPDSANVIGKIPNTLGVHGIAIAPELGRGFTSNGGAATVTIFDLKTLGPILQVPTGKKPDAIVYDPASGRVFAMNGGSNSSTAINAATGKVAGTIDLGGGPEFATADGAGNVFVNLEDENLVLRIDSRGLTVKNRWPLAPCERPSSMAIDPANHRLFIGCRSKVMAVVDAETGKVITTLPIGDHVDASAFDSSTGLIFNSTGEGVIDVFHQDSPDAYSPVARIPTHPGSKTMALDSKTHQLFVPENESGSLGILVFGK
jgi:YVTN family beta-propeller protein